MNSYLVFPVVSHLLALLPSHILSSPDRFKGNHSPCLMDHWTGRSFLLPLSPKPKLIFLSPQALWLQQGYQLEFLGNSSFVPGLWSASVIFFLINTWILGVVIADIGNTGTTVAASVSGISKKAS